MINSINKMIACTYFLEKDGRSSMMAFLLRGWIKGGKYIYHCICVRRYKIGRYENQWVYFIQFKVIMSGKKQDSKRKEEDSEGDYQDDEDQDDEDIQDDGEQSSEHSSINLAEYLKARDNIPDEPSEPLEDDEEQEQFQDDEQQASNSASDEQESEEEDCQSSGKLKKKTNKKASLQQKKSDKDKPKAAAEKKKPSAS